MGEEYSRKYFTNEISVFTLHTVTVHVYMYVPVVHKTFLFRCSSMINEMIRVHSLFVFLLSCTRNCISEGTGSHITM